ncbi:hypothetical protein [Novosphingobium sediminis]|nr:hypothetical protein [Novosphingobium sediminis]
MAPVHRARSHSVLLESRSLALGIIGFLLLDQVLLLAMLGLSPLAMGAAATLSAALCAALWRLRGWTGEAAVQPRTFGLLFAGALVLFILGGEGRFVYANTDWQVRYAVLNDLVNHPWPWAYQTDAGPTMLRCPVGIYLVPALVGKIAGSYAAQLALLVQDAALLTAVVALAAPLFAGVVRPWLTLLLVLGFSGLDLIGQLIYGGSALVHLEQWDLMQYTAVVTLAYWVPQHALAGWIGAAFYLSWRAGKMPLAVMLSLVPALALMSPLGGLGIVPFVIAAGLGELFARRIRPADIFLPAVSVALALPSLLYLASGLGGVPSGTSHYPVQAYVLFYLFEVVPFLCVLYLSRGSWNLDRVTLLISVVMLLVLPFGRVGEKIDFMMRVSIPSLAFIAIAMAGVLRSAPDAQDQNGQAARRIAICVFLIGLVVPIGETARAILLPRAPEVHCGYYGVVPGGYSTYIAPYDRMIGAIRPAHPAIVPIREPAKCWDVPWPDAAKPGFPEYVLV